MNNSACSGWIMYFTAFELVVCVLACIGCGLCLWCLKTCRKMLTGMKILLCTYFTAIFIICLVPLPWFIVANTMKCQVNGIVTFSLQLYILLGTSERNVFMVITLYRMMAVCFPHHFKSWCRWQVVVTIISVLSFSSVLLWSVSFATQEQTDCSDETTSGMGYVLFLVFMFVPLIIIVFTYAFTVLFIRHQQRNVTQPKERSPMQDQVLSLGVLFLSNLILHLPDIAAHLGKLSDDHILFCLVHVLYRLHYVCDPFIFLGLNARYRSRVMRLLSSCRRGSHLDLNSQEDVASADRVGTGRVTGITTSV